MIVKRSRCRLRRFIAPSLVLSCFIAGPGASARAECGGDDGGSSLVAEIRGGDTLILQDGRSVRLVGVLLPRRGFDDDVTSKAREAAEKQIADLVRGQVVELRLDERQRDRYGRILAQIFVTKADQRIWVQEKLILSGQARVMSAKENRRCIPELLAAEKTARDSNQGQWATGLFGVKSASAEDSLGALAQSFEIVEGQVENVAEVKGRTYLNFGKNWRRDFTVTISTEALKLFAGDSGGIARLRGQPVRVRGWIEHVNGPAINVTHPEQLELLTSGTASHR